MSTQARDTQRRELAHRTADGMEIRLLWDTADDTVVVEVFDRRYDQVFEAGVLLLVAFVVCGVFALASPEALARDPDEG